MDETRDDREKLEDIEEDDERTSVAVVTIPSPAVAAAMVASSTKFDSEEEDGGSVNIPEKKTAARFGGNNKIAQNLKTTSCTIQIQAQKCK